ncbi:MAG TPA: hypothetical protein VN203_01690, partial [Candidatus Acidoferrum sp.]|nr:hypothetical protein [Candidatus Acidoferrum sp.]
GRRAAESGIEEDARRQHGDALRTRHRHEGFASTPKKRPDLGSPWRATVGLPILLTHGLR